MFISLKRALKLRKELEAAITKVDLPTSVKVSLLVEENVRDASPVVRRGLTDLETRILDHDNLSNVLMKLRHDIAKSNVANGVEGYLATIAHIDRKLAVRRKIMAAGVTPPAEELQAEIALSKKAIETQDANRYGRADREIGVSVISAEFKSSMAESVADLKRQREQLEDDRTATNAQAKIEIADEQATLLRKYGLL